jgi:hypothetical protein
MAASSNSSSAAWWGLQFRSAVGDVVVVVVFVGVLALERNRL